MKKIKAFLSAVLLTVVATSFAQNQEFKLFKKSDDFGGFGGFSFNLYNADKLFLSGEGAGLFRNLYVGGYGYGAEMGTFTSPIDGIAYNLKHSSGGTMIGAFSNTDQIFALFCEVRMGFDRFKAEAELEDNTFMKFSESTYAVLPSIGAVVRPLSFMQLRVYAGYTFSGNVELNGITEAPYNASIFGIGLSFGGFSAR